MFWRRRGIQEVAEPAGRGIRGSLSESDEGPADPNAFETSPSGTSTSDAPNDVEVRWQRRALEQVDAAATPVAAARRALRCLVPRARDGFAAILSRTNAIGPWPIGHGLTGASLQALARVAPEIDVDHDGVRWIESREFRTLGLYDAVAPRDRAKINRLLVARSGDAVLFTTVVSEGPDVPPGFSRFLPQLVAAVEQRRLDEDDECGESSSPLLATVTKGTTDETIRVLLAKLLMVTGADHARLRATMSGSEELEVLVGPRRPPAIERLWSEHVGRLADSAVDETRPRILDARDLGEIGVETLIGSAAVARIVVDGRSLGTLCLTSARSFRETDVTGPVLGCSQWIARVLEHAGSHTSDDGRETAVEESSPSADSAGRGGESGHAEAVLARASHEIRTPMTGILGMTRFLEETSMTPEQREYLQVLRTSSESLLKLVNDTLDGESRDGAEWSLEPRPTRIRELASVALRTLSAVAAEKAVALVVDIDPDVPDVVHVDGDRLRQVLLNLVGNALKFTSRGEVVLAIRGADESAVPSTTGDRRFSFSVRDTGIGIPRDRWDAIFEDRVQADDTTRARYGGTGLGLGICRDIVGRMGGRLELRSEVGTGTTFEFELPLDVAPVDSGAPTSRSIPAPLDVRVQLAITNGTLADAVSSQLAAWGATVIASESSEDTDFVFIGDENASAEPGHDGPRIRLTWPGSGSAANGAHTLLQPFSSDDLRRVVDSALGRVPDESADAGEEVAPRTESQGVRAGARSVLLVDDDPVSRRLCAEYLRRAGYEPVSASDGFEALDRVAATDFAAILLDVSLPGPGGDEVAQRMRVSGVTIPIVAVTGYSSAAVAEKLEAAGVDCMLRKPVDPTMLVATLDRLVVEPDEGAAVFAPEIDDPSLLAELVALFRETAPPQLDRLRAAVRTLDTDEIVGAAHRLKGSAAVIGGRESGEVLAELEHGPHDRETLARLLPRVEAALTRLDERLVEHGNVPEPAVRTDG